MSSDQGVAVFTIIKQSMYPVEVCVDFELAESQWLRYLALDRAYVYSCLFTSRGIYDYVRDAKFGPVALAYRDRSLQLLRLNLTKDKAAVTDSTLAVVMSLALFSEQRGDLEEAETHMQGLYRLVNLRGGIETLRENYQLQIKVCRLVHHSPYLISSLTGSIAERISDWLSTLGVSPYSSPMASPGIPT